MVHETQVYTVKDHDIVHETSVDFVLRSVSKEVHLVQYDSLLPIVKVDLYENGERYILPSDAEVSLRLGKVDHTFVYKRVLGCNEERNAVYFNIDGSITTIDSKIIAVLELMINGNTAGSSPIKIIIDRNPIQEEDIQSSDYFPIIGELENEIDYLQEEIDDIIEIGGEPNKLESISLNDVPVPIDENKNSNLESLDEAEALSILIYDNN